MPRQPLYGSKEIDEVEFHIPLADRPEFKVFSSRMLETVQSLDHEPSQRELRVLLGVGDHDIERRWWNAAVSDNLQSMEEFQRGNITRYRARELRRTPDVQGQNTSYVKRGRGISLAKSTTPIGPDPSSYEKQRVTA